ncbi:T9SS type A sorting domain-containing protein [Aestuariibaculum sp. M13]|uniref:LamG-like jellyroll fold domain-containing protein n=2 Tax=Flavobacteriaceae TaxID=49546 RepID=UPI002159F45A|nr:LamG-like jellyroll fold domain-containing protein [Aestuariibaculum sp. M13]MCR8668641.1 T9SS type A sorting domain-containing protein [Aestuariibaculum sp. M13]
MKHNYFKHILTLIGLFYISLNIHAITTYVNRVTETYNTTTSPLYYGALSDYVRFVETELNRSTDYRQNISKNYETNLALTDVAGDYRSKAGGTSEWSLSTSWEVFDGTNWVNTSNSPGVASESGTVTIQTGTTISISSNYVVPFQFDSLIIYGTLVIGDGTSNNTNISLTTTQVNIESTGELEFSGNKVSLTLTESNTTLIIESSGNITGNITGDCTNNNEIHIGTIKYAVCNGGSATYTFDQLVAAGGSLNAIIDAPSTSISCPNQTINLSGYYEGTATTPISYIWEVLDPSNNPVSVTNNTSATTASFTPTIDGDYSITFIVTESNGFSNLKSITVTVTDNENPTVNATSNVVTTTSADTSGDCTVDVAITDATFNDNCSVSSIAWVMTGAVNDTGSGQVGTYTFPIGTTTITYTVSDNATPANTATDVMTVTVTDNENPTVNATSNVVTTTSADTSGDCTVDVAITDATFNDNCSVSSIAWVMTGAVNDTGSGQVGTYTFPIGTTTITYTVSDNATPANTATDVMTVTVTDNENPTVNATSNVVTTTSADTSGDCTVDVAITDATFNDNCSVSSIAWVMTGAVNDTGSGQVGTYTFPIGTTTITYTVSDNATPANTATDVMTVTVTDNENPVPNTANLTSITEQCSATVNSTPKATDNCSGEITGVAYVNNIPTSLPITFNTQGAHVITWKYNDGNGNESSQNQTVLIDDSIDPVALCQDITIQLSDDNGTVAITPEDIDGGSSDNCSFTLSASQTEFTCANIGPNIITLTVTDIGGNTKACSATVTVTSPNITGGTLVGYLTNNETDADADNVVEVTACPEEEEKNALLTLSGYSGSIDHWEYSINSGQTWTEIANSSNTYNYNNIVTTTLVRAIIKIGSCEASSNIVYLSVIPPDIPPTIVGPSEFNNCLGTGVTVEAQSEYGINDEFNEGGLFDEANPAGWRVNGVETQNIPAGNSNQTSSLWAETTNKKEGRNFAGTLYNSPNGTKYAIVSGDIKNETNYGGGNQIWGKTWSSLETPIFNTLGLDSATLEFDQAYFLGDGASLQILISRDGGNTYNEILDPGINPYDPGIYPHVYDADDLPHDYTGPSTSGDGTHLGQFVPTSIDLQNYIGETNLRIKFLFEAGPSTNSSWALDNIRIPQEPINETIEWTNENGVVVETGSTTTITPEFPGTQIYGVTSIINDCRADGTEGTEFITIHASLAYAGTDITPIEGKCGESTVQLGAYDNTKTALQNIANNVWDNTYAVPTTATNYPPTNETGYWEIITSNNICGVAPNINDAFTSANGISPAYNDPNAKFTAESGTYILRWNVAGCSSDVNVEIKNCENIDFDGTDDYVTFKNNYNLNSSFSIEAWVKPNDLTGTKTIFSRKDYTVNNAGYDLSIVNGGTVKFSWYGSNGSVSSSHPITTQRWYHIAVTFNGSDYILYVDGLQVGSTSGSSPTQTPSNIEAILGAMDQSPSEDPTNYFNGWIDEVRIWNKALTPEHIRQMMNQEIDPLVNDVQGFVTKQQIYGPGTQDATTGVYTEDDILTWANLLAYYRMNVGCGYLTDYKGNIDGRLRNIETQEQQTAPLPYESINNGDWDDNTTWKEPVVWDVPNSNGINGNPIDWNIVRTSNDIVVGHKNINLLGLLVDSGKLTVTNSNETQDENNSGRGLFVSHYLKLDGSIKLIGKSQLIQRRYGQYIFPDGDTKEWKVFETNQFSESILEPLSTGYIERDQQGSGNKFNYNYWSSPVGTQNGSSNNMPFKLNTNMLDGTYASLGIDPLTINWISGYDGKPSTSTTTPISVAKYWLWTYNNLKSNTYSQWTRIYPTTNINPGIGYSMKGTGRPDNERQNYTFKGKPNNSRITAMVTENNSTLVGNPYPSAIYAPEFIRDNIPSTNPDGKINNSANPGTTGSIDGTLEFWIHFDSNNTHILRDYQGGYATFTLAGGIKPAISTYMTTDGFEISGLGFSTLVPLAHIPVAQGFYVHSAFPINKESDIIQFKNSQRDRREFASTDTGNLVLKTSTTKGSKNDNQKNDENEDGIQRIRFAFKNDKGQRSLLLAFTPDNEASDGYNYGYDARLDTPLTDDMLFKVDNYNLTIQAVGQFDENKQYPFTIFTNKGGSFEIAVTEFENLPASTKVFIYDSLLGTYTKIDDKNSTFNITLDPGNYTDRFYITFIHKDQKALSVIDEELNKIQVNYLHNSREIYINSPVTNEIKQVQLINILGQIINVWDKSTITFNSNEIRLPVSGDIAQGSYIVNIVTSNSNISKKIIIK